ncbi:acyl carrier protein [Chitinophaga qingshengii]|uniref:Acyl carrier protein n=1 Tax=Chitinophaga qingshengii TaxID=1569794 RepID=A0ABR7TIP0_9BACT|nr:phosphopantetheine-binding protein [Chitinophaga qingshengii]MBC9929264.1 acyl carrier protein [Chitinophaga qingshengii]
MNEQTTSYAKTVREWIATSTGVSDFADDLNIFEAGIVNSLFIIQLMTYLERTFQIKITMEDLSMDNFASINNIATFVDTKKEVAVIAGK